MSPPMKPLWRMFGFLLLVVVVLVGISCFDPARNPENWLITKLEKEGIEVVKVPYETIHINTAWGQVTVDGKLDFMMLTWKCHVEHVYMARRYSITNYCNVFWFIYDGILYKVYE